MKLASLSFSFLLLVASATAIAQDSSKSTKEQENINLSGDTFKLRTNLGFTKPPAGSPPTRSEVTAPKDSCFRVAREYEVAEDPKDTAKKTKYVRGTFRTGFHYIYTCKDKEGLTGVNDSDTYDIR